MAKKDISAALSHHLSTILEDCRRIGPALQAYLKASVERPNINFELLRILSNALSAYGLLERSMTPTHQLQPGWPREP